MRKMVAAGLATSVFALMFGLMFALGAPARADWVPPVKGNDTGGIIAYTVATQSDARQIAVEHCASYGKVVKFLAVDARYGGYLSFSCRWVPYGANDRPIRTRY